MEILGERLSFQADHSSTSYLFYAPARLSQASRELAHRFSSRAAVGARSVSYIWHGDYDGLSSKQQDILLADAFEVMVRESYDWWTLSLCLPHSEDLADLLKPFFEVIGTDDCGIYIQPLGNKEKIRISIHCRMVESGPWIGEMMYAEDDRRDAEGGNSFGVFVPHLLNLRKELIKGNVFGLELIAQRFDPGNWNSPPRSSKAARWLAGSIEA